MTIHFYITLKRHTSTRTCAIQVYFQAFFYRLDTHYSKRNTRMNFNLNTFQLNHTLLMSKFHSVYMTPIKHTTVQVTLKIHTPLFSDNLLVWINQTCRTRQPIVTFRSGEYIQFSVLNITFMRHNDQKKKINIVGTYVRPTYTHAWYIFVCSKSWYHNWHRLLQII